MSRNGDRDQANAGEGADPSEEIKAQNPGETTTADLAQEGGEPKTEERAPKKNSSG